MGEVDIKRINFLAKKQKEQGLTEEEKEEQQALRTAFLKQFREGFAQQLDNTYVQTADGNKVKLTKKDD